MVYNYFNFALIWRWFLMIALALTIGLLWGSEVRWEVIAALIVAEIIVSWSFIRFFNQTHRNIQYFIQAVKNEDSSILFPDRGGGRVLDELHRGLNELNQIIKEKNIRNRMNERYFSEILLHIGTAVVVFNKNGFVINTNQAALRLFGLHTFTHLRQLDKADKGLSKIFGHISTYNGKSVLMKKGSETIQLSVRSSVIQLRDETITLATFQDIRGELENKELDSWVKLIKVLNHEIMNSLAPVTSIAQSLESAWQERNGEQPDPVLVDQTVNGLNVIGDRGQALMRFVESYRMFTRMPELKLTYVGIHSFFDRLSILTSPLKENHHIQIKFLPCESDFQVCMDEQLMVQVIINLIKNAIEAMEGVDHPRVEISCQPVQGKNAEIRVTDNGKGIPDEIKEEIFIPFFTTRAQGTGIGLSYSRQILIAHGGSIHFRSHPGRTVFTVRW
jgi:two-component system, NtrC family, nitrogen regulation sensor histidine kinase NtrY